MDGVPWAEKRTRLVVEVGSRSLELELAAQLSRNPVRRTLPWVPQRVIDTLISVHWSGEERLEMLAGVSWGGPRMLQPSNTKFFVKIETDSEYYPVGVR